MAKKSKEEKRLKKEAAKQEKKNKKGKKAKAAADAAVKSEGNGILIPILIALLALVGVFTLAMAGIVGWSYFRMQQARPAAERQVVISQAMPSAQTAGFQLDGEP